MATLLRTDFTDSSAMATDHAAHHDALASVINTAVIGVRHVASVTISAAAPGVDNQVSIDLGLSFVVIGLRTSIPARVRLYPSTAAATADQSRLVTADPAATVPLILEYVTTATTVLTLAPAVSGALLSGTVCTLLAANTGGSTAALTVEVTYLALEAP